jgi:hypothetical protein
VTVRRHHISNMRLFRQYRGFIGVLTALLLTGATAAPGALAAIDGPQPVFPVCSPDGPDFPGNKPVSTECALHCQLFHSPDPFGPPAGVGSAYWPDIRQNAAWHPVPSADQVGTRIELGPLSERGPPPVTG